MLSRREFVAGLASATMLSAVRLPDVFAQAASSPFLYTLDDYVNPAKQPSEMGRLYLADLREPTVLVSWATWCRPCVDKIPKYNEWCKQYGEKIKFIGALQEKNMDYEPQLPPGSLYQWMATCVHNELITKYGYGSELFEQAVDQINDKRVESPDLQKILQSCHKSTMDTYNPIPTNPREREAIHATKSRLQAKEKWPLFPTYVLDNQATSTYLGGKTAFFVTLFRNGRKIKTLEGKSEKEVERELRRMV